MLQMNYENMVEKGEIAHYEQFLLSSQFFHFYSIYVNTNVYIHTVTSSKIFLTLSNIYL